MTETNTIKLPKLFFAKNSCDNKICPICLEQLQHDNYLTYGPCGHVCHNKCYMGWMHCHYSAHPMVPLRCPVCSEISTSLYTQKGLTYSRTECCRDFCSILALLFIGFIIGEILLFTFLP